MRKALCLPLQCPLQFWPVKAGAGITLASRCDVFMTRDMLVGSPHDSVEDAMGLMTVNRIRHLPVVEDGQLLGLISIGDVVKTQHDRLTMENHYLKSYLHG